DEGRVLAAIARMSIRPEPSVVGAVDGIADADAGFAAGIASDCRFDSENSTEFSWRCPVRFSTRPPSCPAIEAPPPDELGQFDAVECAPAEPNRSPPEDGDAAAGAAKMSPPPSPNNGRFAPERRRPPLRSVPLVGCTAPSLADELNTSPMLTDPLSGGARSANSGTADSFNQSANPSFQIYVSARISPRSTRERTSASEIGPTCSPSTTMCQPPSAAAAAGAADASSCDSPPRTTMMWLHFLQRILKTFPRTLSSEIEYFVPQESQMIFINASIRSSRAPAKGPCTKSAKRLSGTD